MAIRTITQYNTAFRTGISKVQRFRGLGQQNRLRGVHEFPGKPSKTIVTNLHRVSSLEMTRQFPFTINEVYLTVEQFWPWVSSL